MRFTSRDRRRVPEHWLRVGSRGSGLSKNAQNATNPANCILNHLYTIARFEARMAAALLGLEPGLGLFHATRRWRDSLALDLVEPIRPLVDSFVLDLLEAREFERAEFFETRKGVVRVMPPLAKELSASASEWRRAVAPLTERLARELMAYTEGGGHGALTRRTGPSTDKDWWWVPTTLTQRYATTGRPKAQRKRKQSALESWQANQRWERENADVVVDVDYESEILAGLGDVKIREIAEATGLSMTYAGAIRSGREVPHRRHWKKLLRLVNGEAAV